jgi:hypothetical protein
MSFGDLAAQHQAYSRPALLGCKERYKQIRRVWQSRSFIFDPNVEVALVSRPANSDSAAGFERRIDRVVEQVDQELIQLISVGLNRYLRTRNQSNRKPRFETDCSSNPCADIDRLKLRLGKPRQTRIRAGETTQRFGAAGYYGQPAPHIFSKVIFVIPMRKHALETAGDRLYWRERVVQFVAEHPNDSLPRLALFFTQGAAEIRKNKQLMRKPSFPECGAPHPPPADPAGKRHLYRPYRFTLEASCQPKVECAPAEKSLQGLGKQPLARFVHQAESLFSIEREDRHINLDHYFSKESGCFHRAETLRAQRLAKRVCF